MTFTTRPTLRGTFGMVSSTHWLATATAMGVLERGGNAFDAAAAAGFTLHVVEPHMNGPAGEVPAIVATTDLARPKVLCGQGPAPAGATIAHYRDLGMDLAPGAGLLAATIPGAVDAWLLLLRDHGTWQLRDVLEPAIGHASAGHPAAEAVTDVVAASQTLFQEHWPTSAALWLPHGAPPRPHTLLRNPAYANTLRRLVAEAEAAGTDRMAQIEGARRAWGAGFVAEAVERFSRRAHQDSSGRAHPGLITADDMAGWSASWEEPLTLDWHGFTVAKTGPWGQGPVLLQALGMLQAHGDPADLDLTNADHVHLTTEVIKLAMADREAWYGDTSPGPVEALLSPAYAHARAELLGELASDELRPGAPGDAVRADSHMAATPRLPGILASMAPAPLDSVASGPSIAPSGVTQGDTCHIDVVDQHGNMIAATPSGGWLQSSPAIPELGFCLGSRAQMFWLEEGLPASLAPGRRPRTTLSPTLVLADGQHVLACGSPGGDQQDQWQLLFLLRHLAGGMSLQQAIDAPAFHTRAFPASFWPRQSAPRSVILEDRLGDDVVEGLRRRGHQVTRTGPWSLGRLCAVGRDPDTGVLSAAANPRGMQGYAAGR